MMTTKRTKDERNGGNGATGPIRTASIAANGSPQAETGDESTVTTPAKRRPTNNVSASGPAPDGGRLTPTNTNRQYYVKRCETCGWEFLALRPWARFCCGNCRRQAWLKRNPERAAELAERDKQRLRGHVLATGGVWVD